MEPATTTIVAALAAGALAAVKDVSTSAVKDLYAALKRLICDRYTKTGPFVDAVTDDPAAEPEQQVLAKRLEDAGAATDPELKALAVKLLEAIQELRSEPKAAALFDFDTLRVRNVELQDIQSVGGVLRVKGSTNIEGDFTAKGIRQIPVGVPEKK